MVQELIKPIVRVGNSAGIVLPKEWLNGKARIRLIEKPVNINKEVLEFLSLYLYDVKGIYLFGSYARGEETEKSDVDVLVVTGNLNKKIEQGKYNLVLISEENLKNSLDKNALPILPMLREAKVILNKQLIEDYKKTSLTRKNLKGHIETTKSALKVNKQAIEFDKKSNSDSDDATAYSLVLRLRGIYIVDCLIKNKKWSSKDLKILIKKTAGSLKAYGGYLRVKNNEKPRDETPFLEAEKLHDYISKRINEQEKWLTGKK